MIALADFKKITMIVIVIMTPLPLSFLTSTSTSTLTPNLTDNFPLTLPLPSSSLLPSPLSSPPLHLSPTLPFTSLLPSPSPLHSLLPHSPYTACSGWLRLGSILTRLRCRRPSERCSARWGYGKIPCSVSHALEAQESWMVLIRFLEAVNVILTCKGRRAVTSTEARTAQVRTLQLFIWFIKNFRIRLL